MLKAVKNYHYNTEQKTLQHANGYGNTGGMGTLEGAKELGYGAFPGQLRMLY
jgi:hypothetical protein